ncbi:MAG TPA: hypothetical protein VGD67_22555, partial [Pseudonocardiaceae bacterium]
DAPHDHAPAGRAGTAGALPVRRPGRLPGGPPLATSPPPPRTERDAEQVRGRLASFRAGIDLGRSSIETPVREGPNP